MAFPKMFSDPSEGQAALIDTLLRFGGGLAQGVGQGKENDAQRQFSGQQNAQQLLASMLTNQYNQQQGDQLSRDKMGMDATQLNPLAQQQARAQFALAGDKVNQWSPTKAKFDYDSGMGSFQGGYNSMAPSQFTKSMFTPEAMARAEMEDFRTPLQRINPTAPVSNAYGAAGQPYADNISAYGQQLNQEHLDHEKQYTGFADKLAGQLATQEQEKKKKGGFMSKLGGVLKFAAPLAASFIPGVGPLAAMAIAGGGAAAGTAMQGGGLGQSLLAGGMGAGMQGVAAKLPGGNAVKKVGKTNPASFGAYGE